MTLRRKTPIARGKPLARSSPLTPKKRRPAERERVYGTEAHQAWLRSLRCVGCDRVPTPEHPHHLHHTRNGGMGRKADASTQVPLCYICHGHLHHQGPSVFGVDALRNRAAHLAEVWARKQSDLTPLSAIVPGVVASLLEQRAEESA